MSYVRFANWEMINDKWWTPRRLSVIRYPLSISVSVQVGETELGRLVDALAPGGDEGRDKLR